MKGFSVRQPVLFEIVLFVLAMTAALILGIIIQNVLYMGTEISMALSRIAVGLFLSVMFRRCFRGNRPFSGLGYALPALLFVLWNAANSLLRGGTFTVPTAEMIILSAAPALFEEVIFRGIFIHNLKENGRGDMTALFISAFLFGAVHLTNIVGMPAADTLVQFCYATVIGLVFGAVYLKSRDILSVMIMHALIDLSSHMFTGAPAAVSTALLAVFAGLMVIETVYAVLIMHRGRKE